MQKKTSEYWVKRMDDIFSYLDEKDLDFFYEIQDVYQRYSKQIQKELFAFYQQYADEQGISLTDAKAKLSKEDFSDYARLANEYREAAKKDPEALKRLDDRYRASKANRLEALNLEMDYALLQMNGQLQVSFERYLKGVAKHVYRKINFGNTSGTFDEKAVRTLINMKIDGENFSTRIWGNTDRLSEKLKETLMDGFIRGSSSAEMARELRKAFNVTRAQAETLLRSESTLVANLTAAKRYMEEGLTKYQYLAYIDGKTTEICKRLNKKVFLLKDYKPGTNAPPMHANCRSAIVPDDEEIGAV